MLYIALYFAVYFGLLWLGCTTAKALNAKELPKS